MRTKLVSNHEVITNQAGPFTTESIDLSLFQDFSIQVIYGAGAGGDLELAFSNDDTNFSVDPDATQVADPLGGSHIWNVSECQTAFCRVNVPTLAGVTVRFVGIQRNGSN